MTSPRSVRATGLGIFVGLLLIACVAHPPVDPDHIGIVTGSAGVPSVIRNGKTYMLARESRIYPGDIIETDHSSGVKVSMIDDTVISVGHDTRFIFHQYKYSPGGFFPRAMLTFTSGAFRAKTGAITDKWFGTFEISTPLAMINPHTADFWAILESDENTLEVAMIDGKKVTVANTHGNAKLKHRGFGTRVTAGSAPRRPKLWSDRELDAGLNETALPE